MAFLFAAYSIHGTHEERQERWWRRALQCGSTESPSKKFLAKRQKNWVKLQSKVVTEKCLICFHLIHRAMKH